MRRICTLIVVVSAAFGCGASAAVANPEQLGTVQANAPIAAAGGWVAWSEPWQGAWRLMAWHDGRVAPLPAALRPQPFDLDLGTDARGRTVATFSRCTQTPVTSRDGRPAPWTGAGCRVHVLDLATGQESEAGVPRSARFSDTTPSMWHGRIAFARRDPHHHDVAQVMLWSPRTRHLRKLRHGAIPTHCPFRIGCKGLTVRGAVEGLDLGDRLVTFLWWVDAPAVVGHGGWEIRADRLPSGRSVLAGAGFLGEACASGFHSIVPSLPAADANHVWFSKLGSACFKNRAFLVRFNVRRRQGASGAVPGQVLQFAKDADALYALVAPEPQGEVEPACEPGAPCTIERLERPPLTTVIRRVGSPFF
jgi:hypothetical protein